ncbi:MAG: hypothetical protein U0232_09985 [Thermomicrobiales bacterium]
MVRFPTPPRRGPLLLLVAALLLSSVLPSLSPVLAEDPEPPAMYPPARNVNADFFGVVGRDPWFEWNTDPIAFPNDVNRAALEAQARDLADAGAGWIRIEMRAEHDKGNLTGPGYIDYRKYDWFVRECAPKYGLKVLMLLGSGLIDDPEVDPAVRFLRINDPPDRPDGTNGYIRLYTQRAKEIADHYGSSVAAYEILNEPNSNDILYRESGFKDPELKPENFGTLLTEMYAAIKPNNPQAQLIVGGLIHGRRASGSTADFDYLYVLYRTKRVQEYRAAKGRFPFDGVAVHAYFIDTPRAVVDHLWQLNFVIKDAGDSAKLWLTEIGVAGTPPTLQPGYLAAVPTASERQQAQFLRDLLALLLAETRSMVANVFWFKYEDFPLPNAWVEFGLVRLPITAGGAYVPPPSPRKLAYSAYQSVANPGALPSLPETPTEMPAGSYFFPQTQHSMSGAFRQYWEQNGGLSRFGFPLTRVFETGGVRVQYFERARFEWHPENADPYKVELGLLTAFLTQGRTFPKPPPPVTPTPPTPSPQPGCPTPRPGTPTGTRTPTPTPTPTCTPAPTPTQVPDTPTPSFTPTPTPEPTQVYFRETGHYLGGEFLIYWKARGGLASYGYPISEELREVNQADGKEYTVQYFERARLEYHPENQGTEYVVLLGLMGWETVNTGGWYR